MLISPRIAAGTVFRAKRGTIDHRSVLKTIEVRWNLAPLTERDKAAPDLGDVLSLATPRSDDPLANGQVAVSNDTYPNQSQASVIDKIYVGKVAALPLRNEQESYDQHVPPDLTTSAAVGDYIQARTAAWTQHLHHLRQRRGGAQAAITEPPLPDSMAI